MGGEFKQSVKNLTLENINVGVIDIFSNQNGSYVLHSVRVYGRALSAEEIKNNYDVDILRFGE